jgi:hypothetical protein
MAEESDYGQEYLAKVMRGTHDNDRERGLKMLKGQMQSGLAVKGSPRNARDMTEAEHISSKFRER